MPVFRFAPSPNGLLHLGHAYSALLNARMARACGGRLLLRIEDIDRTRCRSEYAAAIIEDLDWLGLRFAGPPRRQSEHFDDYRAALARLQGRGLVYPSFESRAEIARLVAARESSSASLSRDPDGAPLYPGSAKSLTTAEREERIASGAPYALRLDMAAAARAAAALAQAGPLGWSELGEDGEERAIGADPAAWGDVVLARKGVPTSYHLSVVVDDALQGVTHVVRGQDLLQATSVHRLLQRLLGLPAPRYHHHRLVLDGQGRKLSKSTGAPSLRALRENGVTPAEVEAMLGFA